MSDYPVIAIHMKAGLLTILGIVSAWGTPAWLSAYRGDGSEGDGEVGTVVVRGAVLPAALEFGRVK